MPDPYDATQLDAELRAAGLVFNGCTSRGDIEWISPPSAEQLELARNILAAHDPMKRMKQIREEERRKARLEELKAKRRRGETLLASEQQEMLDIIFRGVK